MMAKKCHNNEMPRRRYTPCLEGAISDPFGVDYTAAVAGRALVLEALSVTPDT